MKINIYNQKNIPFAILPIFFLLTTIVFISWGFNPGIVNINEAGGVDFGRGPNCDRSRGLCSVEDNSRTHLLSSDFVNASFSVSSSGGLIITFSKSNIDSDDSNLQFQNGNFKQLEELSIPEGLRSSLSGLDAGPIPAGTYPMTETSTYYKVDFSTASQQQSQ